MAGAFAKLTETTKRFTPTEPLKKSAAAGAGAGTELSKLLHPFGIQPSADCSCRRHAETMDRNGVDWCENHFDEIMGWLRTEAAGRGYPFITPLAAKVLRIAIARARKKRRGTFGTDAIHVHHSATGLGDAIGGLYAVCGLADATGKPIIYHAHSAKWLYRVAHPGVTIVPIEEGREGPDINGGDEGYRRQIQSAATRVTDYCGNLAQALGIAPFAAARPRQIDRAIGNRVIGEKYVVLSPFGTHGSRDWPRDKWRELGGVLRDQNIRVIPIGASRHAEILKSTFNGLGGVSWFWGQSPEWVIDLVSGASCVIGNDSGVAHLAGLLGVPALAIHAGCLPHPFLYDMSPSVESITAGEDLPRSDHNSIALGKVPVAAVYKTLAAKLGLDDSMTAAGDLLNAVQSETLLDRDRLRVILARSRAASKLAGDIAEVGVYRGGTSKLLALANPHKTIHSFDTFTGIANAGADDLHSNGDFDLGGQIPPALNQPNIAVHVGLFPSTAGDGGGGKYCFAHFDGDTYESCRAFIEYFTPRMTAGGAMVFDDYRWHKCPGVERALLEVFAPDRIEQTGPTQALVTIGEIKC
jgi:O-methyltransferase